MKSRPPKQQSPLRLSRIDLDVYEINWAKALHCLTGERAALPSSVRPHQGR
jgi:hypothetical protein